MANEGKAQSSLGQLFVDIGVNGAGKALKSLNSISASFLLTKNAAQQVISPLVNFGKEAANNAVQIGKMSAMFGFTRSEYQKLVRYFQDHKISEALIGDVTDFSNMFQQFQSGLSAPTWQQQYAAMKLGMGDLMQYSGDFESVALAISRMQEGVKGLSSHEVRQYLSYLGKSAEWLWAFQQSDFNIRDASALSDQEIEDLIDANEAFTKTVNDVKLIGQRMMADILPKLTIIIDKSGPLIDRFVEGTNNLLTWIAKQESKISQESSKDFNKRMQINPLATSNYVELAKKYGQSKESWDRFNSTNPVLAGEVYSYYKKQLGYSGININDIPNIINPTTNSVQKMGFGMKSGITVNNTNYITSDSPYTVADDLNGITGAAIRNAENNNVQISNTGSL